MQFAHKVNKQQHDPLPKEWRGYLPSTKPKGPPVDNGGQKKHRRQTRKENYTGMGYWGPKCGNGRRHQKYFNIPSQCCSIFAVTVPHPLFHATAIHIGDLLYSA